jgi:hypothetical protein
VIPAAASLAQANQVLLPLRSDRYLDAGTLADPGRCGINVMPRTIWPTAAAIALLPLLGSCGHNYIGSGYATVPVQLVVTRDGRFEVLDRPELGRIAISPTPERVNPGFSVRRVLHKVEGYLDLAVDGTPVLTNGASSPGSGYFGPLMEYFAQSGRSCRLIRGQPLVEPQWEFVYDCTPGFDASVVTWQPSGYSNAPIPPLPLPPPPPSRAPSPPMPPPL